MDDDDERSDVVATPTSSQDRKGKRRAIVQQEPTERTPLLGQLAGTSQIPWEVVDSAEEASHQSSRRHLFAKLTKVFLWSLSITIFTLLAAALLAWSYAQRASGITPQDIINKHLSFKGPQKVKVLSITTDGGVWVEAQGMLGVDVGDALGINTDPDDGFFHALWKRIGRQGVKTLGSVSLNLTTISILPEFDPYQTLGVLDVPSPLEVPLSVDPPNDGSWLTHMKVVSLVRPTANATLITGFLKDAWKRGFFAVRADVDNVYVRGGLWNKPSWRTRFHGKLSNVQTSIRMQVPVVPGLPRPGANVPPPTISELITLKSFSIHSNSSTLNLEAEATLVDPAPPNIDFTSPPLEFLVSLPCPSNSSSSSLHQDDSDTDTDTEPDAESLPIASISSHPFSLTHPNITLHLTGHVLPLSPSLTSFKILSTFLGRYLSGLPNTILVSLPSGGLPEMFKHLSVEAEFPAPNPRPRVLQNVTIRDMKLKAAAGGGSGFLASGVVEGRIVLPRGMEVGLDVSRILPDVLIFDGEVTPGEDPESSSGSGSGVTSVSFETLSSSEDERAAKEELGIPNSNSRWRRRGWKWWDHEPSHEPSPSRKLPNLPWTHKKKNHTPPPREPLPDPLPDRAFGHIRPEEWLNAKSVRVDLDEDEDQDQGQDRDGDAANRPQKKEKETGAVYAVTAKVVDVPLEVLPGRQKEFSSFVSKVRRLFVFKRG
ncbi:hypothetical protein MD484_g4184, partial [Candolleomyces efflorescens]